MFLLENPLVAGMRATRNTYPQAGWKTKTTYIYKEI